MLKDLNTIKNPGGPLSNETFVETMSLIDIKEDSRTDAKINQKGYTNLWLFIIAIYCLIKIIKELANLVMLISLGYNIKEIITSLLS